MLQVMAFAVDDVNILPRKRKLFCALLLHRLLKCQLSFQLGTLHPAGLIPQKEQAAKGIIQVADQIQGLHAVLIRCGGRHAENLHNQYDNQGGGK